MAVGKWPKLRNPELGLLSTFALQLETLETRGHVSLNPFKCENLYLFSDYGGDHSTSTYRTLAFLLCDVSNCGRWLAAQERIREKWLTNKRRLGYKELNDRHCRNAFLPFLAAANHLPGILITLAIDKKIQTLFDGEAGDASLWKPHVYERVLRATHFGALFVAMLSSPHQNIFWVSDEDEIASNRNQLTRITEVFGHLTCVFSEHDYGRLRVGTTRLDDGSRALEDLTSIADVAAGSVADLATGLEACNQMGSAILQPPPTTLAWKARYALNWMGEQTSLQKMMAYIRLDQYGNRCYGWHEFTNNPAEAPLMLSPSVHAELLRRRHK